MFLDLSRKTKRTRDINLFEWLMAGCDVKIYKREKAS